MSKKLVEYKPVESGQWIHVWEYDGKIWAETHCIVDGEEKVFDTAAGLWTDVHSRRFDIVPTVKYVFEETT